MKGKDFDVGKMSVVVFAAAIYLVSFIINPQQAKEAVIYSLEEIKKLLIPLLAAIFMGTTIKNLVTPDLVSRALGGNKGILVAGSIGSLLPPCPYIAYPVIKGFREGGLGMPITIVMLMTATLVEVGQLFCGLVVFDLSIVALRIGLSFVAAMSVGMAFYFVYNKIYIS